MCRRSMSVLLEKPVLYSLRMGRLLIALDSFRSTVDEQAEAEAARYGLAGHETVAPPGRHEECRRRAEFVALVVDLDGDHRVPRVGREQQVDLRYVVDVCLGDRGVHQVADLGTAELQRNAAEHVAGEDERDRTVMAVDGAEDREIGFDLHRAGHGGTPKPGFGGGHPAPAATAEQSAEPAPPRSGGAGRRRVTDAVRTGQ